MQVLYGSHEGFHAIDLDAGEVYDVFLPNSVSAQAAIRYPIEN